MGFCDMIFMTTLAFIYVTVPVAAVAPGPACPGAIMLQ